MGMNRGPLETPAGADAPGAWDKAQAGFRSDWSFAADELTVQGDLYKGTTEEQPGAIQNNGTSGGNLLGRWVRHFSDENSLQAQFYYWRSERRTLTGIETTVNGYDFDGQYAFGAGMLGDIVIGGGYRTSQDRFRPGPHTVFLDPARRTLGWGNGFIQDQIALGSDLSLTLGLKAENNSYTGMEYMPDVRLAWRPFGADMFWGSVSRAVRTPSRFDRDLMNPGLFAGGPDFDSEDVVAYEAGYRTQPTNSSSLSISVFYNVYDHLRTVEASTPAVFPLLVLNNMKGETFGIEAWGSYALADWWRINAGVSTLHKELRLVPGNRDVFGVQFAGNDPAYQAMLRSSMDLPGDLQLDLDLRAIDDLPSPRVPGYFEANARLAWRITRSLEIAIVGTNLLHARHTEFINPSIPAQETPRSVSGTMRWLF
jgi:iron complex outermembrane receptor protein